MFRIVDPRGAAKKHAKAWAEEEGRPSKRCGLVAFGMGFHASGLCSILFSRTPTKFNIAPEKFPSQ